MSDRLTGIAELRRRVEKFGPLLSSDTDALYSLMKGEAILLLAEFDAVTERADRAERHARALREALVDYRSRIDNITSGWGASLPRDVMYSLTTSHYSVAALLDAALSLAPDAEADDDA